jgi:hypothetical protein
MIKIYTGTPGASKTFSAVKELSQKLRYGKRIVTNITITLPPKLEKLSKRLYIWDNADITVDNFKDFAAQHHKTDKNGDMRDEAQTVVFIDEAHLLFGENYIGDKQSKMDWEEFFSQHRKYGYDIVLVTQHIRRIDRCIRENLESEIMCFKFEYMPLKGMMFMIFQVICKLLKIPLFVSITQCVHLHNRELREKHFFFYKKKIGRMYRTFKMYTAQPKTKQSRRRDGAAAAPGAAGVPGPQPSPEDDAVTLPGPVFDVDEFTRLFPPS